MNLKFLNLKKCQTDNPGGNIPINNRHTFLSRLFQRKNLCTLHFIFGAKSVPIFRLLLIVNIFFFFACHYEMSIRILK